MDRKLDIKVYTDGSCSGNPGSGGWAALLLVKNMYAKEKITLKGGEKYTTNNKMELKAVLEALKFIKNNFFDFEYNITVFSDSSYVVSSINNGALNKWALNGWKTTKQKEIANKDLWAKMDNILKDNKPKFVKVKGHSGNKFNEYVDKIAVRECSKYKKILEGM